MTHALPSQRPLPAVATRPIAAAVVAAILTGILVLGALGLFDAPMPARDPSPVNPSVIEAGRQWELERRQVSGHVDPAIASGTQWELERRQLSTAFD